MTAINYDAEMIKIATEVKQDKPKLLLHVCCAPCSSACLERLKDYFSVTAFFYNPNICDGEYEKRKQELLRLLNETGWADFIDCDYDGEKFYSAVKGLEDAPEGGERCMKCFSLRLEKCASTAAREGFPFFATTLTLSPLKNAEAINKIGYAAGKEYGVRWLPSDFKKKNGYLRSIELSKKYSLYRQNFCGCVFSRNGLKNQS